MHDLPLSGDGAYSGSPTYDLLIERDQCLPIPEVVAPPTCPESVPPDALELLRQRDRHIGFIQVHRKRAWQAQTGYQRRSLIESGNSRHKRIISRRVRTRSLPAQQAEANIAVVALNRMFDLGRPITRRVGQDRKHRTSSPNLTLMHQGRYEVSTPSQKRNTTEITETQKPAGRCSAETSER